MLDQVSLHFDRWLRGLLSPCLRQAMTSRDIRPLQ